MGNLLSCCCDAVEKCESGSDVEEGDVCRDYFELRGVIIDLFVAIRDEALRRNPDGQYWSMGRVSAEIIGNHEILKADCRWGHVDANQTLTYNARCSLIDTIKRSTNGILDGKIKYENVVDEKANRFISFTYGDNFIELVDALEDYVRKNSGQTIYFWFDMFVNDQWNALDKDFYWWSNTFKTAVRSIGETIIFLNSWKDPSMLKRAWCLYEISCSEKLSIAISKKEEESFMHTLRSDMDSIAASLCKIKLENATAYLETDRQQIFNAVEQTEDGFNGFNNVIVGLIREWIAQSARNMISRNVNLKSKETFLGKLCRSFALRFCRCVLKKEVLTRDEVDDLMRTAILLSDQGNLDEAKPMYERALAARERTLGKDHPDTLRTKENYNILLELLKSK